MADRDSIKRRSTTRERVWCRQTVFRPGCDSVTKSSGQTFDSVRNRAVPYEGSQFPVGAVDELSRQAVPDVSFGGVPNPNPTLKALSDLAGQVNGAVLMGHSQSGSFPLAAALLNPAVAKGLVLVEPGGCPGNFTDAQIKTLATIPILVIFGDYRATETGLPTFPTWQARFEGCQAMIGRLTASRWPGADARTAGTSHSPWQQPHDHAGQEQPPGRRPDPELDWGAGQPIQGKTMNIRPATLALAAGLACLGTLAIAQTPPTALSAELADYIEMPRTTGSDGRSQAARINVLVEEPGSARLFVAEHAGPLSIVDKATRRAVSYINFNGSDGAPGLFPKFAPEADSSAG